MANSPSRSEPPYPGRRIAGNGSAGVVSRSNGRRRHALDDLEPASGVLLRARLLPLARRAGPGHPFPGLRPPRHQSPPAHCPPGARFFFSHLPLLSARADPASLAGAAPKARAAMYAAGTVGPVAASVAIAGYWWVPGGCKARGFFVRANLWSVPLLVSESLRAGGEPRPA